VAYEILKPCDVRNSAASRRVNRRSSVNCAPQLSIASSDLSDMAHDFRCLVDGMTTLKDTISYAIGNAQNTQCDRAIGGAQTAKYRAKTFAVSARRRLHRRATSGLVTAPGRACKPTNSAQIRLANDACFAGVRRRAIVPRSRRSSYWRRACGAISLGGLSPSAADHRLPQRDHEKEPIVSFGCWCIWLLGIGCMKRPCI